MNLKDLLEKHTKLKLPPFPEDDEFSDWVEDLIEIDGYYYGLADSYLYGERKNINFGYIDHAKISLKKFENLEKDSEIFRICLTYIESLESILSKLK